MAKNTKSDATDVKEKQSANGEAAGNDGPDAPAPTIYTNAVVLRAGEHGDLKVRPQDNHAFADRLSAVVIAGSEFAEVALHYPIVFSRQDDSWVAHAVTGHTLGANNYVGEDGKWRAGTYVPAFIRRYPFILAESTDGNELSLAADMDSDRLSKDEGEALFEDGKPTEAARKILDFCTSFHNELAQTRTLISSVAESGILVPRTADVTLADDTRNRITGFNTVDEQAFGQLDDATFLKMRKSGALALIYCHLISMRNWRNVLPAAAD